MSTIADYNTKERINPRELINAVHKDISNLISHYKEDTMLLVELICEMSGDQNSGVKKVAKKLGRSTTGIKKTYIRK